MSGEERATKPGSHRFNLRPDPPDERDLVHDPSVDRVVARVAAAAAAPATWRPGQGRRPRRVDLRHPDWPVFQQDHLNSCTANAIAGAIQLLQWKERLSTRFVPSRLFIYYNERALAGQADHDAPVNLRTAYKAVRRYGACPEPMWPYLLEKFKKKPPRQCYDYALDHRGIWYARVRQRLRDLRNCLAGGDPITFGFQVYLGHAAAEALQAGEFQRPWPDGRITLPDLAGEVCVGGHAVLAVGYDDRRQAFLVRNSWGADWGLGGYGWFPYAFAMDAQSHSFWTLRYID